MLQCDVIRTMNIFNVAYFSKERLLEGAQAVARSLGEGGVWIVGRTFRESTAGSQRLDSRFAKSRGSGCSIDSARTPEIEELVLTLAGHALRPIGAGPADTFCC